MSNPSAIITQLASIEAGTTGTTVAGTSIRAAYDLIPNTGIPSSFPSFINYVEGGKLELEMTFGFRETVHRIHALLLLGNNWDAGDVEKIARGYVKATIDKIDLNKTLNGTVQRCDVVDYKVGEIKLRGSEQVFVGVDFTLEALEVETGAILAA